MISRVNQEDYGGHGKGRGTKDRHLCVVILEPVLRE